MSACTDLQEQIDELNRELATTDSAVRKQEILLERGMLKEELAICLQATSDDTLTGYLVYSDAGTAGTPIAHTGGVDTVFTNDELGAQTQKIYTPEGVTDLWHAGTTTFDFSELENGDMIDIRLNATVSTTSNNQEIFINLELGQGGFDYLVPFSHDVYKLTGSYPIGSYEGIYLGDDNTRLNGGQFIFSSAEDATIVVHGWYCKIIKHG